MCAVIATVMALIATVMACGHDRVQKSLTADGKVAAFAPEILELSPGSSLRETTVSPTAVQ
jgi:methionine-rich copper-binding protein CopC